MCGLLNGLELSLLRVWVCVNAGIMGFSRIQEFFFYFLSLSLFFSFFHSFYSKRIIICARWIVWDRGKKRQKRAGLLFNSRKKQRKKRMKEFGQKEIKRR